MALGARLAFVLKPCNEIPCLSKNKFKKHSPCKPGFVMLHCNGVKGAQWFTLQQVSANWGSKN